MPLHTEMCLKVLGLPVEFGCQILKLRSKIPDSLLIGGPGSTESETSMILVRLALEGGQKSFIYGFCQSIRQNGEYLIGRCRRQKRNTCFFKYLFQDLCHGNALSSKFQVQSVPEQFFELDTHHPAFCKNSSMLFHVEIPLLQ